jgi:hypothetical protein
MSLCHTCFTERSVNGSCVCEVLGSVNARMVSIDELEQRLRMPIVIDTTGILEAQGIGALFWSPPVSRDPWVKRYTARMGSIPGVIHAARESVVPYRATRLDVPRVDGTREAPMPFREEGVDAADELWAQLVIYAREVAELIGGSSPSALRSAVWTVRGEPQGFQPGVTPGAAHNLALEVALWLIERVDLIATFSELADTEALLFSTAQAIYRAMGAAAVPTLRARRRKCVLCDEWGVVASPLTDRVWCVVCGAEYGGEDDGTVADVLASGQEGTEVG